MKYNKKRNILFVYEALVNSLAKNKMEKTDELQNKIILNIMKENFLDEGSELVKSYKIYKKAYNFYKDENFDRNSFNKMIYFLNSDYANLNHKKLKESYDKLLEEINNKVGKDLWNYYIEDYRMLAYIDNILKSEISGGERLEVEKKLYESFEQKRKANLSETKEQVTENFDIVYKMVIKKFNERYRKSLNEEQMNFLKRYIKYKMYGDNSFKNFYKNEIDRVSKIIKEQGFADPDIKDNEMNKEKLQAVFDTMKRFYGDDVKDEDVEKFLKFYTLTQELSDGENG